MLGAYPAHAGASDEPSSSLLDRDYHHRLPSPRAPALLRNLTHSSN